MSFWILTIDALDNSNNPVTLRFADDDYIDASHNYYDKRIQQAALFSIGAAGSDLFSDSFNVGETTLVNTDGGLDYLADYALDGRQAILSLVNGATIIPASINTVSRIIFSGNIVSIVLRDPNEAFKLNHPRNYYGGTNVLPAGLDGVSTDIKGLPRPRVYGKVRNMTPVLVNSVRYIYECHDGADCTIQTVYDRGIILTRIADYPDLATLQSTAPAAGQFRCYQGYFRVGAVPAGEVTADVDATITNVGSVFQKIIGEAGKAFDATNLATIDTLGEVGIFVGTTEIITSDLLDKLSKSIGGYWTYNTLGAVMINQIIAPITSDFDIENYEIISIERTSQGAGQNGLPYFKVTVQSDQIETVQTDFAAGVTDAVRTRNANKSRNASNTVSATKTRNPLSEELIIDSALRNLSSGQTLADRLAAMVSVRRDTIRIVARFDVDTLTNIAIGKVANLITYKLGYSAGRKAIVSGYTIDARKRRVEFSLWG